LIFIVYQIKGGDEVTMIIEVSFAMVGGFNLGLEKSWNIVKGLMIKYPHATWKRIVNKKKEQGKYLVEIE